MLATMAEPKKKRKPGPGRPKGEKPPKPLLAAFRGSVALGVWLESLVTHCRQKTGWRSISKTDVILKALESYAKEVGYEPKMPNGDDESAEPAAKPKRPS